MAILETKLLWYSPNNLLPPAFQNSGASEHVCILTGAGQITYGYYNYNINTWFDLTVYDEIEGNPIINGVDRWAIVSNEYITL